MGETNEVSSEANLVINNILCYIYTARDSMKKDDIIRACLAFYKQDDIVKGKELLYGFVGEKPKHRRGEDKLLNEMHDLMSVFDRCDVKNVKLPKIVTDSYNGMPPSSGFETVAHHIVTLIDEILSLKHEVEALKESRHAENVLQQTNNLIQEDILPIKGELRKLNQTIIDSNIRRNSLLLTSVERSSFRKENSSDNFESQKNVNSDSFSKILISDDHESNHKTISSDDAELSCVPEFLNDGLMNRLLFDEGGPPSAPSFAEVCGRPPTFPIKDGGELLAASTDINDITHKSSACDNVVSTPQSDKRSLVESKNECDSANVDSEGFQLVQSKKKRKNIIGSKKESKSVLKSAVRTADIFVGNCDTEVTADSLCKYIYDELKVNVHKCESLVV